MFGWWLGVKKSGVALGAGCWVLVEGWGGVVGGGGGRGWDLASQAPQGVVDRETRQTGFECLV